MDRIRTTVKDKHIRFDYSKTDAQTNGFVNGTFTSSASATVLTLLQMVNPDIPHNEGMIAPIEIVIGTMFLYRLLGVSCFCGLAVTCLFLPLNHFAGKVVVGAQENLMKARDERVSLMNEILGGIRMLKVRAV